MENLFITSEGLWNGEMKFYIVREGKNGKLHRQFNKRFNNYGDAEFYLNKILTRWS